MNSPFKFLDAFTKADEQHYFGRKQETKELFQMVQQAPLALLYGLSGTGKTSLVQCGLASHLEASGWQYAFVRRWNDINQSLLETLQEHSNTPLPAEAPEAIRQLCVHNQQPMALILDQFEELFIFGSWEEQAQLEAALVEILQARLRCHILIVMREEFIGRLYGFEKAMPALSAFRLRLAPMADAQLRDVVQSSCHAFQISAEPSSEEWLQALFREGQNPRAGARLPNLQVYLSQLYHHAYQQAYGGLELSERLRPITFTLEAQRLAGPAGPALESFLQQREISLQAQLNRRYPGLPKDTIRKVLDIFVSDEGTSRPLLCRLPGTGKGGGMPEAARGALPELPPAVFYNCLELLEQGSFIHFSGPYAELSHDSIANFVDTNRTDEQRQLNEARRSIHHHFLDYQRNGEYLSPRLLETFEEFLPHLHLDSQARQFIQDSKAHAIRQKAEAQARRMREAERASEKLKTEQQSHRRRRTLLLLVGLITATALILGAWAWIQRRHALNGQLRAQREAFFSHISTAASLKNEGNYLSAIQQLESAASLARGLQEKNIQRDSLLLYQRLAEVMAEADSLALQDSTLTSALARYEEAAQLSPGAYTSLKARQCRTAIDEKFSDYLSRAKGILQYSDCSFAKNILERARQLKPGHPALQELLELCPLD